MCRLSSLERSSTQYSADEVTIKSNFIMFKIFFYLNTLWNDLIISWNRLTILWNEVTWNEITMEQRDWIPCHCTLSIDEPLASCHALFFSSFMTISTIIQLDPLSVFPITKCQCWQRLIVCSADSRLL